MVRSRGLDGNTWPGCARLSAARSTNTRTCSRIPGAQAVDRLVQNATVMGADAVLMMRFDSSEIGQTMSEIVAYGTAAVLEPMPR
ncbi:MAG: heavy metal-binding domain-containing protein [Stellaceae bacterium]